MNSLTKDRAKEKAQNIKKTLKNLGYDVGIRHCYEVFARTSGYESWNAMSAKLEEPEIEQLEELHPSFMINPVTLQPRLINDEVGVENQDAVGEGSKTYEFELTAPAKATRWFEVKGDDAKEAFLNLKNHMDNMSDYEIFKRDKWEIDESDVGANVDIVNPFLRYGDGPHDGFRRTIITNISRYEGNVETVRNQDDEGIVEFAKFEEEKLESIRFSFKPEGIKDKTPYQEARKFLENIAGGYLMIGSMNIELKEFEHGEYTIIAEGAKHDVNRIKTKYCEQEKLTEQEFNDIQETLV